MQAGAEGDESNAFAQGSQGEAPGSFRSDDGAPEEGDDEDDEEDGDSGCMCVRARVY